MRRSGPDFERNRFISERALRTSEISDKNKVTVVAGHLARGERVEFDAFTMLSEDIAWDKLDRIGAESEKEYIARVRAELAGAPEGPVRRGRKSKNP